MSSRARRLIVLLAAVVGVALTGSLGVWQMNRAAQKLALQQAIDERGKRVPLDNAGLPAAGTAMPDDLLHRRASLRGQWDHAHTFFLDNRPMDGRAGFFVVTPLKLTGRPDAVLVQRGWAPRNAAQREALPPVLTAAGEVRIDGRIAQTLSKVYAMGGPETGGPIRQNADLPALEAETGLRLLPLVLLQSDPPVEEGAAAPAAEGLSRHWPPPAVDIHKHYGYAFQWFALAALILGLYVWFQVLAPYRRRGSSGRGHPDAA